MVEETTDNATTDSEITDREIEEDIKDDASQAIRVEDARPASDDTLKAIWVDDADLDSIIQRAGGAPDEIIRRLKCIQRAIVAEEGGHSHETRNDT